MRVNWWKKSKKNHSYVQKRQQARTSMERTPRCSVIMVIGWSGGGTFQDLSQRSEKPRDARRPVVQKSSARAPPPMVVPPGSRTHQNLVPGADRTIIEGSSVPKKVMHRLNTQSRRLSDAHCTATDLSIKVNLCQRARRSAKIRVGHYGLTKRRLRERTR